MVLTIMIDPSTGVRPGRSVVMLIVLAPEIPINTLLII